MSIITYLACLALYWVLIRGLNTRLRPSLLTPAATRVLCLAFGYGLLALIADGVGFELTRGFIGSTLPLLMLSTVIVAPRSDRGVLRVGLIPAGRVNKLLDLRTSQVEWVVLHEPNDSVPRSVAAVVGDLHNRMDSTWTTFLADCQLRGTPVVHAGTMYEALTGRTSLRYLREAALNGNEPSRLQMIVKRLGELTLILLTAPLLLLLAAITSFAIWLESPGPVLFFQERVGFHGRTFKLIKFRSMSVSADTGGPLFAQMNDSRVTKVGSFIRRVRIDEIPQVVNVLRGEMSLIGPRPEQTSFAAEFSREIPFYSNRHNVRPGITGWAQVNNGYAASKEETEVKLEYDLYYVRHLSLWLDARIAWRSVRTVISGSGSR